jgi:hypothetical protein
VTSPRRSPKSPSSSIFPPYVSVIKYRNISQGMFCGAILVLLPEAFSIQVSTMKAEHSY